MILTSRYENLDSCASLKYDNLTLSFSCFFGGMAQKVTQMSSPITGKYNGIGIPTVLYVKEINGNSYRNLTYWNGIWINPFHGIPWKTSSPFHSIRFFPWNSIGQFPWNRTLHKRVCQKWRISKYYLTSSGYVLHHAHLTWRAAKGKGFNHVPLRHVELYFHRLWSSSGCPPLYVLFPF